jgi:sterol desaturase/sphingolipid hydroxylase (fatty acid hydroxylase superfamily)
MWRPLSHLLYPILLLGSVLAAAGLHQVVALPLVLVAGVVLAATGAIIWGLELLHPYQRGWRPTGRLVLLDVIHTGVSSTISRLLKALILLALATLAQPHMGLGWWPTEWPVVAQLALAIPLADFGIYLGHRVMHVTELGWRIHAVHHSPTKLHFWAAARSHPFNVIVKMVAESGTLLLLGIQPDVYALWLVFMTANGLLQHANVDLHPGVLSHVLATNVVHRVHHARDLALSSSNFGNVTTIWDRIFGTLRLPSQPVTEVGAAGYAIPERYGAHLLTPFVLPRFESSE